jgi:uncharacterized ferredoxin-like protein
MVRILRKVITIANGTIWGKGGEEDVVTVSTEEMEDVATTMDGVCDGAPDQQR